MAYEDDDEHGQEDLRELRRQAEEGKAAKAELEAARRERMFIKAGIDPESKLGSLLFKTWDGDDPAQLKAEANELGYFRETESAPAKFEPEEAAQQQIRQGLATGIPPNIDPTSPNPVDAALIEYQQAVKMGARSETARVDAMSKVIAAGVAGDKRVLFNQAAWQAEANRIDSLSGVR